MQAITKPPTSAARTRKVSWTLALQIGACLLIYATANAGYYIGQSYEEFAQLGYAVSTEVTNAWTWIGTVGTAFAFAAAFFLYGRRLTLPETFYFAFLGMVLITATWSPVLIDTFWGVTKEAIYGAATMVVARELGFRRLQWPIMITALLIGVISAALAMSDVVFRTSLGAEGWRGLFAHKNGLAMFCLLSIVLIYPYSFLAATRTNRRWAVAVVALLLLLTIFSQGKTALAAAIAYIIVSSVLHKLGTHKGRKGVFVWTFFVWVALAVLALPFLAEGVAGGEITFTGRTTAWAYYIGDFIENPFGGLGGYTIPLDEVYLRVAQSRSFNAAPDSTFVVLLVNHGVLGILFYLAVISSLIWHHYVVESRYSAFGLCGVLVYITLGVVESAARFGFSFATVTLLFQVVASINVAATDSRYGDLRTGKKVSRRKSFATRQSGLVRGCLETGTQ